MPLMRIDLAFDHSHTVSAMASGRLTSEVSAAASQPQAGRNMKPIQLQETRMKTKMQMASGTIWRPSGPMAESEMSWICSTRASHASCTLPGTPEVALARTKNPSASTTAIATRDDQDGVEVEGERP